MPEGHSVKRLANTFDEWFVGTVCYTSSPQGRFEDGARLLNGRVMTKARSVGKHLFLRFDAPGGDGEPRWLHVHLGLYGAWRFHASGEAELAASIGAPRVDQVAGVEEDTGFRAVSTRENEGFKLVVAESDEDTDDDGEWEPPEPVGQVRLRIENQELAADLSGPTRCEVVTEDEVEETVGRLGPDPLDTESDPGELRSRFVSNIRGSKRPIGELVMDQSMIAGVGNIYRAEGLFRAGIAPARRGANVSVKRLEALWDDYVKLLDQGVVEGRITTMREADRPDPEVVGEDDPESLRWYTYQRTGRDCVVCGNPISEKLVQNRRLFWCPTCQR